ncbi:MAG: hypothetical protein SGARI_006186 [Bacillariaceae sp.]
MSSPQPAAASSDPSRETKQRIAWTVRPATKDDKQAVDELLWKSYSHLLKADYDDAFLEKALPKITVARPELLTCGTWYVVEGPPDNDDDGDSSDSKPLVGCGGFTLQSPTNKKDDKDDTNSSATAIDKPHLRHFATDPDHARKGIASAIWKRTWQDLCSHYQTQYQLPSPSAMEVFSTLTAESFYASLGFQTIQKLEIPLGDDCSFPALLMKRETTEF